jgi:hypothetical protein
MATTVCPWRPHVTDWVLCLSSMAERLSSEPWNAADTRIAIRIRNTYDESPCKVTRESRSVVDTSACSVPRQRGIG